MDAFIAKPGVHLDIVIDPTGCWAKLRIENLQLLEACGYIPVFLTHILPDETAQACFNRTYAFAGGWQPGPYGVPNAEGVTKYPGDPPQHPIALIQLPKQDVFIYPHAFVLIRERVTGVAPEKQAYEIARLD